jgi:hypothetical protein
MRGSGTGQYESIKREVKIRCIYECRCDERLQSKTKEFKYSPHIHWVGRGTGRTKKKKTMTLGRDV